MFGKFFKNFSQVFQQHKEIVEYLEFALQSSSTKRMARSFLRFPSRTLEAEKMEIFRRIRYQFHLEIYQEDAPWSSESLVWIESAGKQIKSIKNAFPYSFHLQSFSSCVPVEWMNVNVKTPCVADLCASPGSKSIQLIEALSIHGAPNNFLWASEIHPKRFHHLESYIQQSVSSECKKLVNINLSLRNSAIPMKKYRNFFDIILLDAPCSGEGIISASNPKSYTGWSLDIVKRNVSIQKSLLKSAIEQLKPGGTLIYSTCTLNPYENEEQIEFVLSNFPQMKLDPMPARFKKHCVSFHQLESVRENDLPFFPGISFANLDLSPCLRIMPSSLYEGFFIAKLSKQV